MLRRRVPALAAFLLLLLTGIAAMLPLRISEPRPASAPNGDFSAARAVAQLDHIAKVPHPAGSAAQSDVREYLVGELRKLGLRPEVQTRVAPSDADSPAVVGSVSNVHATIPGKQPTGRVLVVAHYDSVPIAPGAGDDGSNVAAILEIARVLESDTGKATWVSDGDTSQPAVGKLLTGEPARFEDRVPALDDAVLANGAAKAAPLDTPRTKNASATEAGGVRTIRVRIQAPADAHTIDVHADTRAHQILDATVEGAKLTGSPKHPQGAWNWSFGYAAPPADGIDVVIRTRGQGPLPLRVVSTAAGLPDGVGAPTLAADQSWASWPSVAGQTFVVRTFRL
ncbi:M28 family peptidase [Streptomyces sp. NPDC059802]|uniref:M28 family peptidase n=1 Tax=Streptomyces sp. NPDC059802 TaxID=3346952 RepID=UPI00365F368D